MTQTRFLNLLLGMVAATLASCAVQNPYATTNRSYKKQVKAYAKSLRTMPVPTPGADSLLLGKYWVGTTNFNLRKPNLVVIHHTAQDSTAQTLKTFTLPRTQVSAHYVIGRDGQVYHMLNDYLRAWHGGVAKWGNTTDINSASIGIELDNNGTEPFSELQIASLLKVLAGLKKAYGIPTANFIGHSDIAPSRKNDPSALFPWKRLADNGFGLWYDAGPLPSPPGTPTLPDSTLVDSTVALAGSLPLPNGNSLGSILRDTAIVDAQLARLNGAQATFNPQEALRIIGYDTRDLPAAIQAFKRHFIQQNVTAPLTDADNRILYNLYKKYL
ncbi:N-acetylmuramoyl-L-alanine amidase [Hymenobacter sp. BT770]|uniref:N-acetylmuramoyl-L-alanine amidase n=1 Tax=Hymenobacter sp. BT770 TaxID=2886942 RepID=UPI001D1107E0|nr:N-acetylmuramoyl-L-alanine amidase [Hymenobacter sp. BT770]MCC3151599.1 N-acetylmuramoyl-L-alanine amidase [Hymenobacter sp. BT770]MDO3413823.1 N-acetylmuramoyl-L-alanine amidase [Hymenobacter sp. BT770]